MSKTRMFQAMLMASLCMAACGSDSKTATTIDPITPGDDGGQDSSAENPPPVDDTLPSCEKKHLFVTTSTFGIAGGAGVLDLSTGLTRFRDTNEQDQDSIPRELGCSPVLLERGKGLVSIQELEDPLRTVRTIDVNPPGTTPGAKLKSNPQTVVAVTKTRAYVVRLSLDSLLVIDPTKSGAEAVRHEIDLSPLKASDDPDSVDALDAIRVGDLVYVALARYYFDENFNQKFAADGSVLAVIDTKTDSLVDVDPVEDGIQGIALTGKNPAAGLAYQATQNRLLVGTSGLYGATGVNDGGIEAVDLATRSSLGYVLTEEAAGGEITWFGLVDDAHALVSVGDIYGQPAANIVRWEVAKPKVTDAWVTNVSGALLSNGTLFVISEVPSKHGLRSFLAAGGEETTPKAGPYTFGPLPVYGLVAIP